MIDALYIAETGMRSQQTMVDVISNNIANVNTPAYKKSGVNFVDMVYSSPVAASIDEQANDLVGTGVDIASTVKSFTNGEIQQTDNEMDVAIRGKGFIEVMTEKGEPVYTRAGRLQVDDQGYLSTVDGFRLSANIQIPPDATKLAITESGQVKVEFSGVNNQVEIGNIALASFVNVDALQPLGSNLYRATPQSGEAYFSEPGENGTGVLKQGFVEMSNVSLINEMVQLVMAQRAFQLNSRVIQVSDQLMESVNNLRR